MDKKKKTKNHSQRHSGCPLTYVLDILGDRWSLLLVRDMLIKGYRRYNNFLESDENIATNILADRLRKLESYGIISKSIDPENKRKNIYMMTDKGMDLIPSLLHLYRWSGRHDPQTLLKPEILTYLENDFNEAVNYVRDKYLSRQEVKKK